MKFEFELKDTFADEIIRQRLTGLLKYAVEEAISRTADEEDKTYYRGLSQALYTVLDFFGETE